MQDLHFKTLQQAYSTGALNVRDLIFNLRQSILNKKDNPIWLYVLSTEELEAYIARLESSAIEDFPLYGVPFAIKDNIDLAGVPTTAACEAWRYVPEQSAKVVDLLIQAGAVPLGKTNMDQFATGLVGVRSPWGAVKNVFNEKIISGGSSSGSALAVALGQVSFALGTDTAGSGRVPAVLNGITGLKPSRGLLSSQGLVPACKSLDCISIFSLNVEDANSVFDIVACEDPSDPYSRPNIYENGKRYFKPHSHFRFGVPKMEQLQWFGAEKNADLFNAAVDACVSAGGEALEIDLAPFIEAASLLYEGPWVAERYHATQSLYEKDPAAMLPVIQNIIGNGNKASAVDCFAAQYRLAELKKLADAELKNVDCILTPTIARDYTIAEVDADPVTLNSNLGFYCNFMNLLDYCGIALSSGKFNSGAGFGITLFYHALKDKKILSIAAGIQNQLSRPPGLYKHFVANCSDATPPEETIDLLVCGAHLDGLPLNWQLKERDAVLIQRTFTAKNYRLYALEGGPPYRPGLIRVDTSGEAIEVEVWRMPCERFGSFVAEIPAPLGVGKVEIDDGSWVSGFICDGWGLKGAKDISEFGGWRNYLASLAK